MKYIIFVLTALMTESGCASFHDAFKGVGQSEAYSVAEALDLTLKSYWRCFLGTSTNLASSTSNRQRLTFTIVLDTPETGLKLKLMSITESIASETNSERSRKCVAATENEFSAGYSQIKSIQPKFWTNVGVKRLTADGTIYPPKEIHVRGDNGQTNLFFPALPADKSKDPR